MANEVCPQCGRKQFNSSSKKCYACKAEKRKDGIFVNVPNGYVLDECGNIRSITKYEARDGKIFVSYHYILETEKTTLRGEYMKLASPPKCTHPERLSCNYGEGFERCEYMRHSGSNWVCQAREA
jgi:hypothetical protein